MEQPERLGPASPGTDSPKAPGPHRTDHTDVKKLHGEELTIPRFYAGKNVFVTGGTGFMGKVLLEKLVRCCPDIGRVYCLMRPKNKRNVTERFRELISSKIFDRVRNECPDFEKKIVPVRGDILEAELGISEEDVRLLQNKIHIVFHTAATIKFDEPLRFAMEMNVKGVQKMIKLCRTFKHLEAFVHVSTAFANCDLTHIEETVYRPTVEPQKLLDTLEWMEDDMLEVLIGKLLKSKPNTYVFSKHLAEWLLLEEGGGMPIAIVRPSIVSAAWKEPFPGWIDNYNGPSGLAIAFGKGILRSLKGAPSLVLDFVPVDISVNLMIAGAWYTAVARPQQLKVYNSTTGTLNPFTWGQMELAMSDAFKRTPLDTCFRLPKQTVLTENSYRHGYLVFMSHMVPAYLVDLVCRIMGKKPRMVRLYSKLHRHMDSLTYFCCNSWTWSHNNIDMLCHQLSPEDLKTFFMDPRPMDWPSYVDNYCQGAKKYLLNEEMSNLPAARKHLRMLRNIRFMFNTLVVMALWRTLITRSQIARNLWYLIVKLVFKFVSYFRITSSM